MRVYAFIFARGGSTGLPGKNIKLLGGIPLLGHSIKVAQQIASVQKIFVSTDSEDIAEVAQQYGANVIKRPAHLASNTAAEWPAWQHSIEYLREQDDLFDVFLSLPATSPLRSVADVEQCLAALTADTDAVVTATPASRSPWFNMISRDNEGVSKVLLEGANLGRRQDAPPVYDMATAAYVTRPHFIMEKTGIFTGRVKSVIIPKERAVDIDDPIDFMLAEAIYNKGAHHAER